MNMQINRLFEIVYLLLDKKKVTAKELAQKFEVSTRTIYRDIDLLSAANIPIYCEKGKGGGIGLLDDFILDKSLLSEKDQNEILAALQGLEEFNMVKQKETLEKMSHFFQRDQTKWIDIEFSSWGDYQGKDFIFEQLKQAILAHHVIEYVYYNSYGEETKRKVEPLQIKFKDKSWYLIGYCREKQDYRIFKIQRIKQMVETQETFQRKLPVFSEQREKNIRKVSLKLEIDKELAYRVYDEFKKEEITKQEDGNFLINVEYPENDWVYQYILSFGGHIVVLAPEKVKKRVFQEAEKMKKRNQI